MNKAYSGKLLREKPFANFAVLWLSAKVFAAKVLGLGAFQCSKSEQSASFLRENRIFNQLAKVFSLESFLLYGALYQFMCTCYVLHVQLYVRRFTSI